MARNLEGRPWACPYHRGELEEPKRCRFFEIGYPRTATRSLFVAANRLGLAAMHGFGKCKLCEEDAVDKFRKGDVDFDVYKSYDYVGHIALCHWKQLAEERPDAKFILPVRDVTEWQKSAVYRFGAAIRIHGEFPWFNESWRRLLGDDYLSKMKDPSKMSDEYMQYLAKVRSGLPQNRRLSIDVFNNSDHQLWVNLCWFFGVDKISDGPFPHKRSPANIYRYENREE